jgi:hypothetical protein
MSRQSRILPPEPPLWKLKCCSLYNQNRGLSNPILTAQYNEGVLGPRQAADAFGRQSGFELAIKVT